jgi:hypothetical protein
MDIEPGDATPDQGGPWAKGELGLGVTPCEYANASTMPAVKASLARWLGSGWRSKVRLWVANWTFSRGLLSGYDADQWTDHGPNGENYDESSVTSAFLGIKPAPKPVPDIGGAQHYERYPANAPARPHRERASIIGWDTGNGSGRACMKPVRRPSCKVTRAHMAYDLGRDQALYAHDSKALRNQLRLPGRIQGLSHRLNNGRGLVRRWL